MNWLVGPARLAADYALERRRRRAVPVDRRPRRHRRVGRGRRAPVQSGSTRGESRSRLHAVARRERSPAARGAASADRPGNAHPQRHRWSTDAGSVAGRVCWVAICPLPSSAGRRSAHCWRTCCRRCRHDDGADPAVRVVGAQCAARASRRRAGTAESFRVRPPTRWSRPCAPGWRWTASAPLRAVVSRADGAGSFSPAAGLCGMPALRRSAPSIRA
jgi:hypothetical protein